MDARGNILLACSSVFGQMSDTIKNEYSTSQLFTQTIDAPIRLKTKYTKDTILHDNVSNADYLSSHSLSLPTKQDGRDVVHSITLKISLPPVLTKLNERVLDKKHVSRMRFSCVSQDERIVHHDPTCFAADWCSNNRYAFIKRIEIGGENIEYQTFMSLFYDEANRIFVLPPVHGNIQIYTSHYIPHKCIRNSSNIGGNIITDGYDILQTSFENETYKSNIRIDLRMMYSTLPPPYHKYSFNRKILFKRIQQKGTRFNLNEYMDCVLVALYVYNPSRPTDAEPLLVSVNGRPVTLTTKGHRTNVNIDLSRLEEFFVLVDEGTIVYALLAKKKDTI